MAAGVTAEHVAPFMEFSQLFARTECWTIDEICGDEEPTPPAATFQFTSDHCGIRQAAIVKCDRPRFLGSQDIEWVACRNCSHAIADPIKVRGEFVGSQFVPCRCGTGEATGVVGTCRGDIVIKKIDRHADLIRSLSKQRCSGSGGSTSPFQILQVRCQPGLAPFAGRKAARIDRLRQIVINIE